jgi:hypothetical protein
MFRFTIRDVLSLMVVVGLCAGWLMSYTRGESERREIALERDRVAKTSENQEQVLMLLEYVLLNPNEEDSEKFDWLRDWAEKNRDHRDGLNRP